MIRILDRGAVERLLTPAVALAAMRELFALPAGATGVGRHDLAHPRGWLRTLPGFIEPLGVFGFKTLNRAEGVGMRYAVYVHDLDSGELIGVVDGLELTNLRTGAVSALGTDHLGGDVATAALIGTGQVAAGQLAAIDLVRPAGEIRVFSRTEERRRRFVDQHQDAVTGRLVEATTLEEAIDGAELITLATTTRQPILMPDHVVPGVHVNSVGPASRDRVEVAPAAFARFDRIVCDSADLVLDEAGDAAQAVDGGYLTAAGARDLAEVVAGRAAGRQSPTEATLFKSVGTGVQDLMVAARLLAAAEALDTGETIPPVASVKPFGSASH